MGEVVGLAVVNLIAQLFTERAHVPSKVVTLDIIVQMLAEVVSPRSPNLSVEQRETVLKIVRKIVLGRIEPVIVQNRESPQSLCAEYVMILLQTVETLKIVLPHSARQVRANGVQTELDLLLWLEHVPGLCQGHAQVKANVGQVLGLETVT
jgi:hypothetical protein